MPPWQVSGERRSGGVRNRVNFAYTQAYARNKPCIHEGYRRFFGGSSPPTPTKIGKTRNPSDCGFFLYSCGFAGFLRLPIRNNIFCRRGVICPQKHTFLHTDLHMKTPRQDVMFSSSSSAASLLERAMTLAAAR